MTTILETANGLLNGTLHGKPPLKTTMALAQALVNAATAMENVLDAEVESGVCFRCGDDLKACDKGAECYGHDLRVAFTKLAG